MYHSKALPIKLWNDSIYITFQRPSECVSLATITETRVLKEGVDKS